MKITSNMTHIATEVEFEAPLNEDQLSEVFQKSGVQASRPSSTSPSARRTTSR